MSGSMLAAVRSVRATDRMYGRARACLVCAWIAAELYASGVEWGQNMAKKLDHFDLLFGSGNVSWGGARGRARGGRFQRQLCLFLLGLCLFA